MRSQAFVFALLMATATAAVAQTSPAPCPGIPFVTNVALLDGVASSDSITIDSAGMATMAGHCDPVQARWRVRKDTTTRLRVRWLACDTAERVRLVMDFAADCASASGRVAARRHPRILFTASAGEATTTTTLGSGTTTTSGPTTTTTVVDGGTGSGLFEAPNPWNKDVSGLPPSGQSATIISALATAGGWGNGNNFQIDFGLHVLHRTASTPFVTFQKSAGYYSPDCDEPFPFPRPVGGAIEAQSGYTCPVGSEDCHLLVVDPIAKRLYEMYNATSSGGTLVARCALSWDLTRSYPDGLRGEQCTSADAAGFPIAAMLFTADEVFDGQIDHAIRFILPNSRMRAGVYVHPASHAGGPSGGANLPPYGVRFRLRADYPLATLPSEGARVIARALQKYGMFLSDGGNIALTAASDAYTTHTWDEVGVDSHSMYGIQVTDFEVVDLGPTIPLTYDCVRNP